MFYGILLRIKEYLLFIFLFVANVTYNAYASHDSEIDVQSTSKKGIRLEDKLLLTESLTHTSSNFITGIDQTWDESHSKTSALLGHQTSSNPETAKESLSSHSSTSSYYMTTDYFAETITPDQALLGVQSLPIDIQYSVILHLPIEDQKQWRLVSKLYRDKIDLTFFGPVYDPQMKFESYSSEVSGGTIGSHILNLLSKAKDRVIIASDKCTNEELLDDLVDLQRRNNNPLEIRIVTGNDRATNQLMTQAKYSGIVWTSIASNNDNSGKMHNKFIVVDDHFVITGSPNLTYAAYNYNVESFVAIYHRFVAQLYLRYYEYVISGNDKYDKDKSEFQRVSKMMHIFNNAPDNLIKVCLAPIYDIKSFIVSELNSSQIVDINMFLVSRASVPSNDIVDNLLNVVSEGGKVTIKVDGRQYDAFKYMRAALSDLARRGEVYKVSKKSKKWRTRTKEIRTMPQFHDKLVLIQQKDGVKKVFIGSAGFTDNVQDNLNLENMILIKTPEAYDSLLMHFNAINSSIEDLEMKKL